ncbi:MAG: DUF2793 domain-containing protein [Pseudomonadota bacterium]
MSDSDFTPRLGLPYLLPNQAQKHVTVNESLRRLDALVLAAIEGQDANEPSLSPNEGESWLTGSSPTGLWQNMPNRLVFWADGAWHFEVPQAGWRVYDKSESQLVIYDGTSWTALGGETQNLSFIGLATIADDDNPFAARLNTALFTAREVGDFGSGDLRVTLNKETTLNTGSVLFQSGWSGRSEIGLVGNDDLAFRVSSDGSSWIDALKVDGTTGGVGIGGNPSSSNTLTVTGRFRASSSEGYVRLWDNGTIDVARHSGGPVYIRSRSDGSILNFGATDSAGQIINDAIVIRPDQAEVRVAFDLAPSSTTSTDLGTTDRIWRDLYLQNAPTVSSDIRGKIDVDDLGDPLSLLEFLRPVTFRRVGEDRRHFGFIAQEVREALNATGFEDAALWRLSEADDEDSSQMLCQEELIAVLVAAFQKIIVRLEALEVE